MNTAIVINSISSTSSEVYGRLADILPMFLGALTALLVGIALGFYIKKVIIALVQKSGVRKLLDILGANAALERMNIHVSFSEIFGEIARWYIISFAILVAAKLAGLNEVSMFFDKIVAYIPQVLLALIILFFGIRFSDGAFTLINEAMRLEGARIWRVLAMAAKISILVFASLLALSQLGVDETLILVTFIGFVGMVALAGGLAFGLGGKDMAAELLYEAWGAPKRDKKKKEEK